MKRFAEAARQRGVPPMLERLSLPIFRLICVEDLSYREVGALERTNSTFKAMVVRGRVWQAKFRHDFPGLRKMQMTPEMRDYLNARSQKLTDQPGERDWTAIGGGTVLDKEKARDYTLWKRYYELMVRFPSTAAPNDAMDVLVSETDMLYQMAVANIPFDTAARRWTIAVVYGMSVRLYELRRERFVPIHTVRVINPAALAYTPDGDTLIVGTRNGTLYTLDVTLGELVLVSPANESGGGLLRTMAVSTRMVALSFFGNQTVRLLDYPSFRPLMEFNVESVATSLAFHSSSMLWAGTRSHALLQFNIETQSIEVIAEPSGEQEDWTGRQIILGPTTTTTATFYGAHLHVGPRHVELDVTIHGVSWHPSGLFLAVLMDDDSLRLYDSETLTLQTTVDVGEGQYIQEIQFSPDGTALVCARRTLLSFVEIRAEQQPPVLTSCQVCGLEPAQYYEDPLFFEQEEREEHLTRLCGEECQRVGASLRERRARKRSKVMREFAAGRLRTSHGRKVTSRDQALAIAYSEARRKIK